MFEGCRQLTEIKTGSGWKINDGANTTNMYTGCPANDNSCGYDYC